MGDWNCVTVYTKPSKLAEIILRDTYGLPSSGKYELIFHQMYWKLKSDQRTPLLCTLCCNVVTHFEILEDGNLTKIFSPLKFFIVSGSVNDFKLLDLGTEKFTITNNSEIKFWISDLKTQKRQDIEIFIRMSHRRI